MSLESHQFPSEVPMELENRARDSLGTQLTRIFSEGCVLLIDGTRFTLSEFGYSPNNSVEEIFVSQYLRILRDTNQHDLAGDIKKRINPDSKISMLKACVVMPGALEHIGFIKVDYPEFRHRTQAPLHGVTLGRKQWSKAKTQASILPLIVEASSDNNNLLDQIIKIANKKASRNRTFLQQWSANYLESNYPELKSFRQTNRIGREVFLGLAQQNLGDLTEPFKNGQLHGQFLFKF